MNTPTPAPSNLTVWIYRGIGILMCAISSLIAYALHDKFPQLHVLEAAVYAGVGKALGIPLEPFLKYAFKSMPAAKAADVTAAAVAQMPPERAEEMLKTLLASIPPATGTQPVPIQAIKLVNTDHDRET